jgi:SOS-response transcriptional repressor LexA
MKYIIVSNMETVKSLSNQVREEIKRIIASGGMQAQDFAATINVSKSYLSNLLSGERQPSRSVIERLQEVYGFRPEIFVGRRSKNSDTSYIELYLQEAGAGPGVEISDYQAHTHIAVPSSMLGSHRPSDIKAVTVNGDSMIDEHIHDGDYVLFNLNDTDVTVHNGGIFVISVDNTLLVKHVSLSKKEIRLISANDAAASLYPDRVFRGEDRNQLRVAGKVIAWTHYDE